MTGMEHVIEKATKVIRAAIDRQADIVADGPHLDVQGVLTPHWIAEALATNGLLAPAPLRDEALADEPEPWRCPGCNSDRWIRASLTRGLTVITQCVPCGRYVNCPPPGRAEGDGSADR